jgi:hypothetical protein
MCLGRAVTGAQSAKCHLEILKETFGYVDGKSHVGYWITESGIKAAKEVDLDMKREDEANARFNALVDLGKQNRPGVGNS